MTEQATIQEAAEPPVVPSPYAERVAGLRAMADFLEENGDTLRDFGLGPDDDDKSLYCGDRDTFARAIRLLGEDKVEVEYPKNPGDSNDKFVRAWRRFGPGCALYAVAVAARVCERVVTHTVEVEEWTLPPLLVLPEPDMQAAADAHLGGVVGLRVAE